MFHTIGQRQGLGIGGMQGTSGEPWYVCGKDIDNNRLIVAQGKHHPALFQPTLIASDLHWIAGTPPGIPLRCHARIRYRQADQACEVRVLGDDHCEVHFDAPQRAVTPGQAIVFYSGDICIGGGTIQQ
jgi:tRNA-specific 2-thiouridylase